MSSAKCVGLTLLEGFRALQDKHPMIGDVRCACVLERVCVSVCVRVCVRSSTCAFGCGAAKSQHLCQHRDETTKVFQICAVLCKSPAACASAFGSTTQSMDVSQEFLLLAGETDSHSQTSLNGIVSSSRCQLSVSPTRFVLQGKWSVGGRRDCDGPTESETRRQHGGAARLQVSWICAILCSSQ